MPSSNLQRYSGYLSIMYYLIKRDLKIFKEDFANKFINLTILVVTTALVFSYFLPQDGLKANYGSFILVGIISGIGFLDVLSKVFLMSTDIEGNKTIYYQLILPLPSWLLFVYIGIGWGFESAMTSLLLFPIGKLALFSSFTLSHIHFFQFFMMLAISNLFFGFFALWFTSILKKASQSSNLFMRVINPMYMCGGYYYSWQDVYNFSPYLAYLNLLNPLIYVMEGMRAAILGPEGHLPFWISFISLFIFTLFLSWDTVRRLKKKLDCV